MFIVLSNIVIVIVHDKVNRSWIFVIDILLTILGISVVDSFIYDYIFAKYIRFIML